MLAVVKRSGVTEPFSRDKVVGGVRRACQGRPVDEDALQQLAHRVEEAVRAGGTAEVPSHEVGLAILGPLRELDEVAYLRFASVYRSFSSIEDFEKEIAELRRAAAARTAAADRARVTPRRSPHPQHVASTGMPVDPSVPAPQERESMTETVGTRRTRGRQDGRRDSAKPAGLTVERIHTTAGVHPYDEVTWERRDVVMTNWRDGTVNFEQRGVEFPELLVGQRHQHRHQQVLPRRRRLRRSASRACAS